MASFSLAAQTDVHAHIITDSYRSFIDSHKASLDEGFPLPEWSVSAHLAFMDKAGIQTSVLTVPAPQPYFGDAQESAIICRELNEECAAIKSAHPGRFRFCAVLPLPNVRAALAEAKYALEVLGADGVKLATNAYGQYLGDEDLEPLMSYLNERKAVIIIHPHKPSSTNEALVKKVPLASYEYLAETTRAVLNMIASDVLVRYPDLKVVVPHCGSFLPNALPRFKGLLPVMTAHGYMKNVDVEANMSRLYYDLAGAATDDVIKTLLTITVPDHLLYGSDYPYVSPTALLEAKASLEKRLPALGLNTEDLFSNNARRLFGEKVDDQETGERIVRIAEIEVFADKIGEYLSYAKEVGETSMAMEPGVIALFSMQSKDDPTKVYIVEVYADKAAYQHHIGTEHFRKYKEGTASMVKSLKLIDTVPLVSVPIGKSR